MALFGDDAEDDTEEEGNESGSGSLSDKAKGLFSSAGSAMQNAGGGGALSQFTTKLGGGDGAASQFGQSAMSDMQGGGGLGQVAQDGMASFGGGGAMSQFGQSAMSDMQGGGGLGQVAQDGMANFGGGSNLLCSGSAMDFSSMAGGLAQGGGSSFMLNNGAMMQSMQGGDMSGASSLFSELGSQPGSTLAIQDLPGLAQQNPQFGDMLQGELQQGNFSCIGQGSPSAIQGMMDAHPGLAAQFQNIQMGGGSGGGLLGSLKGRFGGGGGDEGFEAAFEDELESEEDGERLVIEKINPSLSIYGTTAPVNELEIYRVEGAYSINELFTATLYLYSRSKKVIKLKDVHGKLFSVNLDLEFVEGRPLKEKLIVGYPKTWTKLMYPEETLEDLEVYNFYKVELVSDFWKLTQDINNRVFAAEDPALGISVKEALERLLLLAKLPPEVYSLDKIEGAAAVGVKHHCFIQYNESTYDFIERLMQLGGIFAYDSITEEGSYCRVFTDLVEGYKKFSTEVEAFHISEYAIDGADDDKSKEPPSIEDRVKIPYSKKQGGVFFQETTERINITEVTCFGYNPDDFKSPIKGKSGEPDDVIFSAEYYPYSQGTETEQAEIKAKSMAGYLKSVETHDVVTTLPICSAGMVFNIKDECSYIEDQGLEKSFVAVDVKFQIGYPANYPEITALNNVDGSFAQFEESEKMCEYNFSIKSIPATSLPQNDCRVMPSPAVGKYLDAIVVNQEGMLEAPDPELGVDTNEAGDVYVGLFLEYDAKLTDYEKFSPIRVKMNTTNGVSTPYVNTPCTVIWQDFGAMMVYTGQRHDKVNTPFVVPMTHSCWQRNGIVGERPEAEPEQLIISYDHTLKNMIFNVANDHMETIQHNMTQKVVEGDAVRLVEMGMLTETVEKNIIIETSANYNLTIAENQEVEIGENQTVEVGSTAEKTVGEAITVTAGEAIETTAGTEISNTAGEMITNEAMEINNTCEEHSTECESHTTVTVAQELVTVTQDIVAEEITEVAEAKDEVIEAKNQTGVSLVEGEFAVVPDG